MDEFIINHIELDLLLKQSPCLSSSLYNPQALIEFSLTDLSLAYSPSTNGWGFESNNEQPAKFPTLAVTDLHDKACYKNIIWTALRNLGLQECFFEQVVEELRVKVVEEVIDSDSLVYANVHILRVSVQDDYVSELIDESSEFEDEDEDDSYEISWDLLQEEEEEEEEEDNSDSSLITS